MKNPPDWDKFAKLGILRGVIDPNDQTGFKNALIDEIHWNALSEAMPGVTSLLDFGCGTGRFAKRLSAAGVDYQGVDASAGMVAAASAAHPTLRFASFDGLTLPFPAETFDAVFTCTVLQYVVNTAAMDATLSEIRRVLMPGGRLLSLEQISLSDQSSGTVGRTATREDYVKAFSSHFKVKGVVPVRLGSLSPFSRTCLRYANLGRPLFGLFRSRIAKRDMAYARRAPVETLASQTYFEVLFEAVAG